MAVSSKPVPPPSTGIRRYLPRTWKGWLLSIFGPIFLLLVIMYVMARMTPSWYEPLDPNSQSVIDASDVGEHKVMPGLWNAWQRVPLGEQLWTISQTEVNSLLAVRARVPENLNGKPYPKISGPFVMFSEGGHVTLAARTTRLPGPAPAGGVASVTFTIEVIPNGPDLPPSGKVTIESVQIGNLRVPKSLVAGRLRAMLPMLADALEQGARLSLKDWNKAQPQIDAMLGAIERGEPFPLKIARDRPVIIKDIRVNDGMLTVILAPEVPAAVRPRPMP
jgi:hypothetical protein